MKELILGGVRSGKSRLAEGRAAASGHEVLYVATAQPLDGAMAERIEHHRARRPDHWGLVEEPLRLGAALRREARAGRCLLVECLTLWLTNLLCAEDEALFARERADLIDAVATAPGTLIMVSNETGLGVVPLGELSRRYCDEAGWLHQELAALCDRVTLTVAGLPHTLKGAAPAP